MVTRVHPPKPKKTDERCGRGDIYVSIGEDEPGEPQGDELAVWTGDLLLGMAPEEAVALATDILLAYRNGKAADVVQVWLPPSTVRVIKPQ